MIAALLFGFKRGAYVLAPVATDVLCRMKSLNMRAEVFFSYKLTGALVA